MLTRVLARAVAPEVRICGVAPAPVAVGPGREERRAAETPLGRAGTTLVVGGGRLLQSAPRPGPYD